MMIIMIVAIFLIRKTITLMKSESNELHSKFTLDINTVTISFTLLLCSDLLTLYKGYILFLCNCLHLKLLTILQITQEHN